MKEYDGEVFDCVVIDGSNIITKRTPTTKGFRKSFDVERLVRTIESVHRLGWPTYVGMNQKTFRHGVSSKKGRFSESSREVLEGLIDRGVISMIDDDFDDDWLIRAAIDMNGWILSNDRYRKEVKLLIEESEFLNANEINKRMCRIEFVGSEPTFVLPENGADLGKTAIVKVEHTGSAYNRLTSFSAEIIGESEVVRIQLPVGVPLGRKQLSEALGVDEGFPTISRSHFMVNVSVDGHLVIQDLGSKNGTVLNGLSLPEGYCSGLSTSDLVKIGEVTLKILPR